MMRLIFQTFYVHEHYYLVLASVRLAMQLKLVYINAKSDKPLFLEHYYLVLASVTLALEFN